MVMLSRRVWMLPEGEWVSWVVERSVEGSAYRELFDNFRDALSFYEDLARALKKRIAAHA